MDGVNEPTWRKIVFNNEDSQASLEVKDIGDVKGEIQNDEDINDIDV